MLKLRSTLQNPRCPGILIRTSEVEEKMSFHFEKEKNTVLFTFIYVTEQSRNEFKNTRYSAIPFPF